MKIRVKKAKEQDSIKPILQYLAFANVMAFRLNSGKVQTATGSWVQLAPKGASDIVGILPETRTAFSGRWLCVELKRPGGKLRKEQAAWLDMMRERGALCCVVRDVEELRLALRSEGYEAP